MGRKKGRSGGRKGKGEGSKAGGRRKRKGTNEQGREEAREGRREGGETPRMAEALSQHGESVVCLRVHRTLRAASTTVYGRHTSTLNNQSSVLLTSKTTNPQALNACTADAFAVLCSERGKQMVEEGGRREDMREEKGKGKSEREERRK
eukprot:1074533-Rhodomonas_salina.2